MADEKTAETPKDEDKHEAPADASGVATAAPETDGHIKSHQDVAKTPAGAADVAKAAPETDGHIKSHQDVAKAPVTAAAVPPAGESRTDAVKRFVANSQPQEILEAIEEQAKVLMHLIQGIPDGVQHAWHSVAGEIAARKL